MLELQIPLGKSCFLLSSRTFIQRLVTFFIQLCNDKNSTYVTYNFLPPVGKYIIQIFYIFLFSLHVANKRRSSCIRQKFELICFLRQGYLMIDVSTLISLFSKEINFCITWDIRSRESLFITFMMIVRSDVHSI